jgi:hypothetical protein
VPDIDNPRILNQTETVKFQPVEVQCYAGHRADESPRRFKRKNRWVEVDQIMDRWYQGARDPEWPIAEYFKVSDRSGRECLLRHDREADAWYLVSG